MSDDLGGYNKDMGVLAPSPLKRLSRPQPDLLPPLRISRSHLRIVQAVAQARFLTSKQISDKVGGSHQKNLRRLHKLWAHGFLDRPIQQHAELAAFFDEGNRPLVYGLGRRGARLLADHGMAVNAKLDWTTKNSRASAPFLAHTIEVAEVMLAFEFALRDQAGLTLIDHHHLLPEFPAKTQKSRNPFALHVSVEQDHKPVDIAAVPDRLFSLVTNIGMRQNLALELDRGQMSIDDVSRKLIKSSYRRKLIGYWQAFRNDVHTRTWGDNFKSLRVLTVTTSETRIAHMIALQRTVTDAPPGLFLYSTMDRIAAHGPFGSAWISAKGDGISLLTTSNGKDTA